jgi:hypothetical protein
MIIIFWEMTPCGSYKSVIFQKMIIIIVTAVETSNLTLTLLSSKLGQLLCLYGITNGKSRSSELQGAQSDYRKEESW